MQSFVILTRKILLYIAAGFVVYQLFSPASKMVDNKIDIRISGTQFEGGGGLIRDSMTYSTILNKSLHVYNIRANRPGAGGLRGEHVVAVDTMCRLAHATAEGNEPQSRDLIFRPHAAPVTRHGKHDRTEITIELIGSAGIALTALMPYVLFGQIASSSAGTKFTPEISAAGIDIVIRAGTLCIKAPSFHYLQQVYMPTLALMGLGDNVKLLPHHVQGWHTDFVQVKGELTAWVKPLQEPMKPFVLDKRGTIVRYVATATCPKEEMQLFEEILAEELPKWFTPSASNSQEGSRRITQPEFAVKIYQSDEHTPKLYQLLLVASSTSPAAYIGHEHVYPQVEGFPNADLDRDARLKLTWLTRATVLGLKAELEKGNAIDEHLQTMLVPFQALADGWSSVSSEDNKKILAQEEGHLTTYEPDRKYYVDTSTLHQETAEWVAEEAAGVKFETRHGRHGCHGLGIGSSAWSAGNSASM